MQFINRFYVAVIAIFLAVALLYGGFLHNPILFDDISFFIGNHPQEFLDSFGLKVRDLAYATLALNVKWGSDSLVSFRLVSLSLHASVGVALYFFLAELRNALILQRAASIRDGVSLAALLAALIFVLHPVAVYGAAYLIQRTIVMATLFALLSWIFVLRASHTANSGWWWASLFAYALSVWSKENAVLVPAVSVALAVCWRQTHRQKDNVSLLTRSLIPVLLGYAVIGLWTAFQARAIAGSIYEFNAQQMLDTTEIKHPWPLSVMTQATLFFKYAVLWLLPDPEWMSVDMREPFANSFTSLPHLIGTAFFIAWPFAGVKLLLSGARKGLIGFAMLAPFLLFATELTTVRIQEPFVLYRSYLWFAPAFAILLLTESVARPRVFGVLMIGIPLLLFPLAWDRLTTFTSPLALWTDAKRLIEGKQGLMGVERIYHSRGLSLYNLSRFDEAIEDYSLAIAANPKYFYGYNDRGACLFELKRYQEALENFEMSLRLKPNYPRSLMGRGVAKEALGRTKEAQEDFRAACKLNWKQACEKI